MITRRPLLLYYNRTLVISLPIPYTNCRPLYISLDSYRAAQRRELSGEECHVFPKFKGVLRHIGMLHLYRIPCFVIHTYLRTYISRLISKQLKIHCLATCKVIGYSARRERSIMRFSLQSAVKAIEIFAFRQVGKI